MAKMIGRLKVRDYSPGDTVRLNCCVSRQSQAHRIGVRSFRIHAIYPKFIVLDTGKYKTCVDVFDFRRGFYYGFEGGEC